MRIEKTLQALCFLEDVEPKGAENDKSRKIQTVENREEMQQRREVGVVVFRALTVSILRDETVRLKK